MRILSCPRGRETGICRRILVTWIRITGGRRTPRIGSAGRRLGLRRLWPRLDPGGDLFRRRFIRFLSLRRYDALRRFLGGGCNPCCFWNLFGGCLRARHLLRGRPRGNKRKQGTAPGAGPGARIVQCPAGGTRDSCQVFPPCREFLPVYYSQSTLFPVITPFLFRRRRARAVSREAALFYYNLRKGLSVRVGFRGRRSDWNG